MELHPGGSWHTCQGVAPPHRLGSGRGALARGHQPPGRGGCAPRRRDSRRGRADRERRPARAVRSTSSASPTASTATPTRRRARPRSWAGSGPRRPGTPLRCSARTASCDSSWRTARWTARRSPSPRGSSRPSGTGAGRVIVAPWRQTATPTTRPSATRRPRQRVVREPDLWEYPVWFWHWASPDEAPGRAAPVRARRGARGRKHARHPGPREPGRAAVGPEGDETLLTEEMLAHFEDGPEHYLRRPRRSARTTPSTGSTRRRRTRGGGVAVVRAAQARPRPGDAATPGLRPGPGDRLLDRRTRRGAGVALQARAGGRPVQRCARGSTPQVRGPRARRRGAGSTCHTTGPRTPPST